MVKIGPVFVVVLHRLMFVPVGVIHVGFKIIMSVIVVRLVMPVDVLMGY